MSTEPFVVVARVARTHGLKGEVSVTPVAGASFSSLAGLEMWFTPPSAEAGASRILSARQGPRGTLVTFDGIDSISAAQSVVGAEVLVRSDALPAGWFDEAEEPVADLEGYRVIDSVRGGIGRITETIVTGANDVWVVEGGYGEVLIPVIDDVVVSVDEASETIEVKLLEGLLPEECEGA
jgi:16S rRNA processing protein RimM